jgi:hypothetical protein
VSLTSSLQSSPIESSQQDRHWYRIISSQCSTVLCRVNSAGIGSWLELATSNRCRGTGRGCCIITEANLGDHSLIIIPAGTGKAIELRAGQHARIGLPEGPQVADLFAFALPELDEVLSTAHTRSCALSLCPEPGNAFYSNQRRAMITLVKDTSILKVSR